MTTPTPTPLSDEQITEMLGEYQRYADANAHDTKIAGEYLLRVAALRELQQRRAQDYRIVEMAGEVCAALGINAPGEDAVANWPQVLQAIRERRAQEAQAESRNYAELRERINLLPRAMVRGQSSPLIRLDHTLLLLEQPPGEAAPVGTPDPLTAFAVMVGHTLANVEVLLGAGRHEAALERVVRVRNAAAALAPAMLLPAPPPSAPTRSEGPTCSFCNGSGEIGQSKTDVCPVCNGHGRAPSQAQAVSEPLCECNLSREPHGVLPTNWKCERCGRWRKPRSETPARKEEP